MKLIGIALAAIITNPSSCNAFAPQFQFNGATMTTMTTTTTTTTRTQPLQATNLEGWKIDGHVKPLSNFILIQKAEEASESEGGILFSNSAKVKKTQGKVVSVGPGKVHPDSGIPFPMPVSEGDNVIYGQYDGTEVSIDGVTHSLIRDDDILVKYTGDELTTDSVSAVNEGVLVFVETKETATSSGLILSTGDDNKRPSTGSVVSVGPGRMGSDGNMLPMNVAVGDQVKFLDYAGNEVKIGDDDYSLVKMPEIIAKF